MAFIDGVGKGKQVPVDLVEGVVVGGWVGVVRGTLHVVHVVYVVYVVVVVR